MIENIYLISNGHRSGYDFYKSPSAEDVRNNNYFGSWVQDPKDAKVFHSTSELCQVYEDINGKIRQDQIIKIIKDVAYFNSLSEKVRVFNGQNIIEEYRATKNAFLVIDFKIAYSAVYGTTCIGKTCEIMDYLVKGGHWQRMTFHNFKKSE